MSQHANDETGSDRAIPETITCPRALFGHDLQRFLEGRIDQGQQIALMGDFNSEYVDLREWMMDLGLLDIIGKKMVKTMHQKLIITPNRHQSTVSSHQQTWRD